MDNHFNRFLMMPASKLSCDLDMKEEGRGGFFREISEYCEGIVKIY
ncbi:hypothetical protein SD77_1405 [Bacillus badius]|uniref:Uncharacterized protein n=1 Tax=Bacillus badius TaxID=1455 RepID=A0ABR5ARN4_BACBA|nr:hypothetical protein SD77_1405 [Bacillus badius]